MSILNRVQNAIVERSFLDDVAESCDHYLRENPRLHKIVLMLNHLFRTLGMSAVMQVPNALPFCVAGSLIYRVTVEKNCAFKFTLPALVGAFAIEFAEGLIPLISGAAFASLEIFAAAFISVIPLILHSLYVYLTVDYEVDRLSRDYAADPLCCCNSGEQPPTATI